MLRTMKREGRKTGGNGRHLGSARLRFNADFRRFTARKSQKSAISAILAAYGVGEVQELWR
jgi:hypothetical protein